MYKLTCVAKFLNLFWLFSHLNLLHKILSTTTALDRNYLHQSRSRPFIMRKSTRLDCSVKKKSSGEPKDSMETKLNIKNIREPVE